ncbi:Similar to hypothetical protein SNOG_01887 [Phaeosphaeria nodorum SN15]; acc. no. XP_001792512 [Pyronema omphalodes CBS 100304]|uniref:Uncharacterized protein n=1 Tax=Pyronema omphalodes (strain CBS 100304) TaxID=1076935 RepID=U4KZQ8_PYROM|nr:Similar to hypothetical protein SNOG_01887 [Phaeosphaeria nodorum SN15]; acc. no. XP_001792512 [Pyronema omphalodes CBS 100304]
MKFPPGRFQPSSQVLKALLFFFCTPSSQSHHTHKHHLVHRVASIDSSEFQHQYSSTHIKTTPKSTAMLKDHGQGLTKEVVTPTSDLSRKNLEKDFQRIHTAQGTLYCVYFDIYLTLDGSELHAELVV